MRTLTLLRGPLPWGICSLSCCSRVYRARVKASVPHGVGVSVLLIGLISEFVGSVRNWPGVEVLLFLPGCVAGVRCGGSGVVWCRSSCFSHSVDRQGFDGFLIGLVWETLIRSGEAQVLSIRCVGLGIVQSCRGIQFQDLLIHVSMVSSLWRVYRSKVR